MVKEAFLSSLGSDNLKLQYSKARRLNCTKILPLVGGSVGVSVGGSEDVSVGASVGGSEGASVCGSVGASVGGCDVVVALVGGLAVVGA